MDKHIPEPRALSNALRPGKSQTGRITLVRGDITKQDDVDAIVSAIGTDLGIDGSLNQSIMAAAGEQLDAFMLQHIYKPRAGDAFALPGFNLPVDHVIYVVMPRRDEGLGREDRDLLRCYRHAMELAHRMRLRAIAFPALGCGHEHYPVKRAVRLAVQGITERQIGLLDEIRIVCDRDDTYEAFQGRLEKDQ